ncbi:MAG: hypothetical protein ACT4P2_05915 [Pseudomonadota bacterium]
MRRILHAVGWRLNGVARWLVLPVSLLRVAYGVCRAWRDIRSAEVVVINEGGGFGHLIVFPDALRRLYPGRRVTLLFAASPEVQNWYLPRLWTVPRLHLLPFGFKLGRSGRWPPLSVPYRVQEWLCGLLAPAIRKLWPNKIVLASAMDLHFAMLRSVGFGGDGEADPTRESRSVHTVHAYFRLLSTRAAPPVRLPAPLVEPIRVALDRLVARSERKARKLCCLYLRWKGSEQELESGSRSGSVVIEWMPAIRSLIHAGYQCLMIGDRYLPDEFARETEGWLADARILGQDPFLFSLFAATEADLFVGESGGGSWLPGVNGIPTLIVNNFPYFQTRYRATVFFKFWEDPAGQAVDPRRAFRHLSQSYRHDGYAVRSNAAAEIEAAVRDFLDGIATDIPYGVPIEQIVRPHDHLWYALAESRISPAWLRLADPARAEARAVATTGEPVIR